AFGGYRQIPTLAEFYDRMVELNHWEVMDYTREELAELENIIDHEIDINYNYTTLRQMKDRYLISNRVTGLCLESPQFMFMGMAMQNMQNQPRERRMQDIAKLYRYLNELKIKTPTLIIIKLRLSNSSSASYLLYTYIDSQKLYSIFI